MGWYHYQCAEDGTPNVDHPMECPDGTCKFQPEQQLPPTKQSTTTKSRDSDHDEPYLATTPIYHLCQERLWRTAVQKKEAYFPPTFWSDGKFTRASCQGDSLLLDTANHYYKDSSVSWICLELDPVVLRQLGIVMVAQRGEEEEEDNGDTPIQCLKVFGGIPTTLPRVVRKIFVMERTANGTFVGKRVTTGVPGVVVMDGPSSCGVEQATMNQNEVTKAVATTTTTTPKKRSVFWRSKGKS